MLLRHYALLAQLARPEGLPAPAATGPAKEWAQDGARLAMSRELSSMPLSRRLAEPDAYRRQQKARRQALEALIVVEPDRPALERALDLICMIVEEASWSANSNGTPFDDDQHPDIDFQCAETLMLLAWTCRGLGARLGPRVAGKLLYEARRRVFSPFLAHVDYPFMRFSALRGASDRRALCVLCDILLSAILLETDGARRGAILKQALRQIDQAIQNLDRLVLPLEDVLAETAAVTDLAALLRKLTRGEMDVTGECPPSDWLDGLLFPWLERGFFTDPAGGDMRPPLSGQALFRVGLATGDEALAALGAKLYRENRLPSATVTGRILDLSCAGMLSAQAGNPPRLKRAATAGNRVMLSRFGEMTCAMHNGGSRGNAGSLSLFCGGRPILVEVPGHAGLPLIGGTAQLEAPGESAPEAAFGADVCPADFETEPDRDLMSVDLTHAWPRALGIRAFQRTAMVQRRQQALRLVDAVDLESPAAITFRFITPQRPQRLPEGLRLGPVDMAWEGELTCDIAPLGLRFPTGDAAGEPLCLISLTTPHPVSRAFFTFSFAAGQ